MGLDQNTSGSLHILSGLVPIMLKTVPITGGHSITKRTRRGRGGSQMSMLVPTRKPASRVFLAPPEGLMTFLSSLYHA